jgi:hypothetical protein
LRGEAMHANFEGLKTVAEIGELARERWIIPRAYRRPEFQAWTLDNLDPLVVINPRLADLSADYVSPSRQKGAGG